MALALLPAGTLMGHGLAYHAHHGAGPLPHAYLSVVSWIAAALTAASLGWFLRRSAAGDRLRLPAFLLLAQPAAFVFQESVEHLLAGHPLSQMARSPAVRWGLALQLLAALAVMALSRLACATGRVLAGAGSAPLAEPPDEPTTVPMTSIGHVGARLRSSTSERGPPISSVPA